MFQMVLKGVFFTLKFLVLFIDEDFSKRPLIDEIGTS